jgi:hypothetical protein
MRRLLVSLTLTLAITSARAAVETTTIIFNVATPGGVAATSGTVTLVLSAPGTTPDGGSSVAVAGRTTANIASDGSVSIAVVPNDVITPSATYYTFQFLVLTPAVSSWTQTRLVATDPDPATLSDCIQTNPPLGAATPVSRMQDEGADLHSCAKVNYVGSGVAAAYSSITGACIVTVSGGGTSPSPGGHTIYDETTARAARTGLRFQGASVNCVDNPGADATDCSFTPATAFSDLTGVAADAQIPNDITINLAAVATALAVDQGPCASGLYAIDTNVFGAVSCAQVLFSQIGGTVPDGQIPSTITRDTEVPGLETDPGVPLLAAADYGNPCNVAFQAVRRNAANTGNECFVPSSATSGGDVVGPASSTDNCFVVFSGTSGKIVKNCPAGTSLDASGNAIFAGSVRAGDPGNTARRLLLFGNTAELAGAALPAIGEGAFYALGAAGSELPSFRNASNGVIKILNSFGGTYGDFACAAGTCDLSAGVVGATELAGETGTGVPVMHISPNIITPTGIVKADVGLGNVDNTSNATERAATATLTNKRLDGGPAGAGTTRGSGSNIIQTRTHNTDCTSLVDGETAEQCIDLDDGKTWNCIPTSGACDTAGEWKRVDATGGSGLSAMVIHENLASPTSSLDKVLLRTTQAINVDSIYAALTGTTSVTWDLVYSRTANEPTTLGQVLGTDTVTSSASGVSVTPGSPVIPIDSWVRLKASAASGTPSNLFAQITYSAATAAQCNDGVDNDSANGIDYPADTGCSSATDNTEAAAGDSTAPEAITNLAASTPTATTCLLSWTAPHEDGGSGGNVASYDCRVRAGTTFVSGDFAGATALTGEPTPSTAGSAQSPTYTATIPGASPSTAYAFACKSDDEVPNTSAISNATTCTTTAGDFTDIQHFQTHEAAGPDNTGDYNMAATEYGDDTSGTRGLAEACNGAPDNCISTTAAKVGTYGYEVNGNTGNEYQLYNTVFNAAEGSFGTWIRFVGTVPSHRFFHTSGTGNSHISLIAQTTGQITCEYGDARSTGCGAGGAFPCTMSVSSATSSIAPDTWYFVECSYEINYSSTADKVRISTRQDGAGSPTTADIDDTEIEPVSGHTFFYFGNTNGVTANCWMDNEMLSNQFARDLDALRNDTVSPR